MAARALPAAALLGVAALFALLAPGAAAHAVLVDADPAVNARVDVAPAQLVLYFSEPIEERGSSVQVRDTDGTRYDTDNLIDPATRTFITVPLAPMEDGVYTVAWRTYSVDTHSVSGQYLLAVNVSFDAATIPQHSDTYARGIPEEGFGREVAVRSLGFVAASLVAGIPLVLLVVPAHGTLGARRPQLLRLAAASGIAAAVAALLLLLVIGGRIDAGVGAAAGTVAGQWVTLRGAAALAAAGAALVAVHHAKPIPWLAAAGAFGAVAFFATAMSGHAAAETSLRGPAIAVDVLHQVGVAWWVAGVVTVTAYAIGRPGGHDLAHAIRAFSPWAVGAVLLIIATGLGMSLLRLLTLTDLQATVYGRALAIKLLLLLPLLVLGALHRLHGQRRLDVAAETPTPVDDERVRGRLRASLLVEVLLMVAVLAAAGTLATVAPPDSLPDVSASGGIDPNDVVSIVATFEAGGWRGTVRALPQPFTVGPQNLTLSLERLDADAPDVRDAYLVIRSPEEGQYAEGTTHAMLRDGRGGFYLAGFLMPQSGTWHNDVIIQGGGGLFHDEHLPLYVQPAA